MLQWGLLTWDAKLDEERTEIEMPDLTNVLPGVVFLFGAAWLLWFGIGTYWNVRQGHQTLRWMRPALALLGEEITWRWLGSAAIELKLAEAQDPFRVAEVVVAFEPRDVPVLWWWSRVRGRRDLLILRGRLRHPPRFELEILNRDSWTGREALDKIKMAAWSQTDSAKLENPALVAVYNGQEALRWIGPWLEKLRSISPRLSRLSVRRAASYHLQLHIGLPRLDQVTAEQAFRLFQDIGQQATSDH